MRGGLIAVAVLASATWLPQQTPSTSELRGLSALDATHAWASGSGGTILRTRDGKTWEKLPAPTGGEALDFRDVEALNGNVIVLMSAGPGDASRIYRSTDGGATWTHAHTNPEKDGFYDAIAFFDAQDGLVLGDPVNGKFRIRATHDGGATWASDPGQVMPAAWEGEGAFAASGTCLFALKGGNDAWFVTGRREGGSRLPHDGSRPPLDGRVDAGAGGQRIVGTVLGRVSRRQTRLRRRRRLQAAAVRGLERHPHGGRGRHVDAGPSVGDGLLLRGRPRPRRARRPRRGRPRGRGRLPRRRPVVDEDRRHFHECRLVHPPETGWAAGPKGSALRFASGLR